jgi:hypothetical protein
MLTARATAELCRAVFPDVLAGISHTIEELTDGDVVDGELIDYGPIEAQATPAAATGTAIGAGRRNTTKANTAPSEPETVTRPTTPLPPLPGEDDDAPTPEPEAERVDRAAQEPQAPQIETEPPLVVDSIEVDSVEVDHFPPDPEPPIDTGHDDATGPRYSGPQLIAMKFSALGITDRDDRLKSVSAIIGRDIASGNDLTAAEVGIVLDTLNEDPDAATVTGGDVVPPAAPATVAAEDLSGQSSPKAGRRPADPPPADRTGDQWRDLLKQRGVKAAALLGHARTVTGGTIATLDDIAGHGIDQDLVDFIEDASLATRKK